MSNFSKALSRGKSIDLNGKNQLKTDDVLERILTVKEYAFAKTSNGETAIVLFEEEPNGFYFGGKVLVDILKEVHDDEALDAELHETGMQITLHKTATKDGKRSYINVEIL